MPPPFQSSALKTCSNALELINANQQFRRYDVFLSYPSMHLERSCDLFLYLNISVVNQTYLRGFQDSRLFETQPVSKARSHLTFVEDDSTSKRTSVLEVTAYNIK